MWQVLVFPCSSILGWQSFLLYYLIREKLYLTVDLIYILIFNENRTFFLWIASSLSIFCSLINLWEFLVYITDDFLPYFIIKEQNVDWKSSLWHLILALLQHTFHSLLALKLCWFPGLIWTFPIKERQPDVLFLCPLILYFRGSRREFPVPLFPV